MNNEIHELREKVAREEVKTYIYEQFIKKVEYILYSETSTHFQEPMNYEKVEFHLKDMLKRIEKGCKDESLPKVPVIYRTTNLKTYVIEKE